MLEELMAKCQEAIRLQVLIETEGSPSNSNISSPSAPLNFYMAILSNFYIYVYSLKVTSFLVKHFIYLDYYILRMFTESYFLLGEIRFITYHVIIILFYFYFCDLYPFLQILF